MQIFRFCMAAFPILRLCCDFMGLWRARRDLTPDPQIRSLVLVQQNENHITWLITSARLDTNCRLAKHDGLPSVATSVVE